MSSIESNESCDDLCEDDYTSKLSDSLSASISFNSSFKDIEKYQEKEASYELNGGVRKTYVLGVDSTRQKNCCIFCGKMVKRITRIC